MAQTASPAPSLVSSVVPQPPTAPPITTLPITEAPITTLPITEAPTSSPVASTPSPVASTTTPTGEPISSDPPTPAPFVTEEPTIAPVTNNPTDAPLTSEPTDAPVTDAPTVAPVTSEPTDAPVTGSPTAAPVTDTPTLAPITDSPTAAPIKVTTAPTTSAPTTAVPTTSAPTTSAPTTAAPTTAVPTTSAPTTSAPTTSAPTTSAPTTAAPTNSPVEGSSSPTVAPTKAPSSSPTAAPSSVPSASPTTLKPTTIPSVSPSSTVTLPPTSSPSATPSTPPKDTENPSLSPSSVTLEPTSSLSPTEAVTLEPTKAPVASDETSVPTTTVDETTSGLTVTFTGICVVESPTDWSETTTDYFAKQYKDSGLMTDTKVEVTFTSQESGCGRRNMRGLQANSVEVTYEQALAYSTSDSTLTLEEALQSPLSTQQQQDEYVAALKELDGYSDLTSVSAISMPATIDPLPNPEGGGIPQWAIIVIIMIGVLTLVVLFLMILRKRRAGGSSDGYVPDEPTYEQSGYGSSSGPGLGDETVETMDYDYAKAYGGTGDASLSEAGGTMGSRLAPQAGNTIFSDDPTFNEAYDGGHEEVIDIFAPAGKLGVVIDTPNDDAPVVHAVKDTSPIATQVRVGDKLVAVDDEDVRAMTAIKVSKLISKKSTQEARKLTIIRYVSNS
eukprot:CAMPEP_0201689906 /NCGR_PEP_ID=MMETSP0578-20130828/3432_1 /ASSEMBLY_ACC=CAM_ASM_000663 /TAXON_ID=267565 /ORGANISM="Skeletonema grethea, Strain CCMP 1804" /LENGTH=669 /DNA_ID=CAMNT_0048174709 /DNA_START=159 /DNA_END=2168 /DNA_ORIENTATION=+